MSPTAIGNETTLLYHARAHHKAACLKDLETEQTEQGGRTLLNWSGQQHFRIVTSPK